MWEIFRLYPLCIEGGGERGILIGELTSFKLGLWICLVRISRKFVLTTGFATS